MKKEMHGLLSRLEPPSDYFNGVRSHEVPMPNNIILFCNPDVMGNAEERTRHCRFVLVNNFGKPGTVVLDGRYRRLEEGQSMLFFPFQSQHYIDTPDTSGWLYITFDMVESQRLQTLRNRVIRRSARLDAALLDYVRTYRPRAKSARVRNSIVLALAGILEDCLLLAERARSRGRPEVAVRDATMEKLLELIFQWQEQPLSISFLANKLHMSESNLRRMFRSEFGISLGHYIRSSKMLHGAKLLTTTDMSISDIAPLCGFDSVYAFSRAFSRAEGMSPLQYRRAHRPAR